jgi:hypothetical protein
MDPASGVLRAIANGTVRVTATAQQFEARATVTVAQVVSTVQFTHRAVILTRLGSATALALTLWDANSRAVSGKSVTWTSSDPGIAAVDDTGAVTAVAIGTAAITATVDGASDTATVRVGFLCFPSLVPDLTYTGKEENELDGRRFTTFWLAISNWASFPDELFYAAPDLPPCGGNAYSGRTWLHIFDGYDRYVYGYCGMGTAAGMTRFWFATPAGSSAPASVYVRLIDRACDVTYVSNRVSVGGP